MDANRAEGSKNPSQNGTRAFRILVSLLMSKQTSTEASTSGSPTSLPTIWTVPDDLWDEMAHLLQKHDPPKRAGRKRIDARNAFNGILFRMRTGCQWNQLPERFGDDSSIHRTFQRWQSQGLFGRLLAVVVHHCQELDGVAWDWLAADGCLLRTFGAPKRGRKASKSAPILPTEHGQEPSSAFS